MTFEMPHPEFGMPGSRKAARVMTAIGAMLDAASERYIPNAEFEGHKFSLASAFMEERWEVRGPSYDDLSREGFDLHSKAARHYANMLPLEMRHAGLVAGRVADARRAGLTPLAEAHASRVARFGERWAAVHDLVVAAKAHAVKGRRKVDPSELRTPPRTIDHTGTCGCCERNAKLAGGKVVPHGFRLNWNERVGNCIGVGHPPDEVSPAGLDAYRAATETRLSGARRWLAKLRTSSPDLEWPPSPRSGRSPKVGPGDADYPRAHQYALSAAEGEVKAYDGMARRLAGRRDAWVSRPLPDGDKRHLPPADASPAVPPSP